MVTGDPRPSDPRKPAFGSSRSPSSLPFGDPSCDSGSCPALSNYSVCLVPSGELTCCNGTSPFFMGKSTLSMAIFNCYVSSPEGTCYFLCSKALMKVYENICCQECSINIIIMPMDRPLHDTKQENIYDQEWCEDNVIFVCQNGYSQHTNTRFFVQVILKIVLNSCNLYHIFIQYGYDQCTLIRNADNLVNSEHW